MYAAKIAELESLVAELNVEIARRTGGVVGTADRIRERDALLSRVEWLKSL